MLDKWMEKMLQSAASAYMPQLGSIAESRRTELNEIKSLVRTKPEEVEAWFDKEIEKVGKMDVSDMLNKLR
jgi:hypothetical protein